MQFSFNVFSSAYFVSAGVAGALAVISYRRRAVIGAVTLVWIMLALTWWSGCAGIEDLADTLPWHMFWARLGYFGIVSVPVLWLIFAIQYSRQEKAPSVRKLLWLWIVPALTMLMLWTNEWHGLVWSSVQMIELQGIPLQSVEHGTYFWIHAVYTYGAVLAGAVIFVRRAIQAEDAYRSQAATMLLAVLILLAGNGLYLFKLLPFRGLDITPFAFTISSLVLAWGLFRFKLLDLMPIASEVVLRNLGDGILVTDASGRIIYINPALENLAWLTKGTSIGHAATEVFYNWPDIFRDYAKKTLTDLEISVGSRKVFFEINISPLFENRVFVGCIYVMRDISERVKVENRQSLLRQKIEKDSPGEFTPILIVFRAQDSKIVDVNTEFVLQTGFSRPEALGRTALQLGLLEATTRSDLTRRLRAQNQLVDEILLVSTKAGEPRAWKVSISKIVIEDTELDFWAAKPVKQA
jgi:PAS domain S-box-containing protein